MFIYILFIHVFMYVYTLEGPQNPPDSLRRFLAWELSEPRPKKRA